MSRFLKRTIVLLVAAALGGCTTLSPQADSEPEAIRLATWNLEHLSADDGKGCRPRTDADYAVLRKHADRVGADVVAFQEVENTAAAARVFPADRWAVVMSGRPDSGRQSTCGGGSGQR